MKKLDLQKVIREEVKKALNEEGYFTTSLEPKQVESLTAVVTKIDELKQAVEDAYKMANNSEIKHLLTVGGLPDVNMLRARMTSISKLKHLEK
jgi:PHP family Zn ribbon phosphoesterase